MQLAPINQEQEKTLLSLLLSSLPSKSSATTTTPPPPRRFWDSIQVPDDSSIAATDVGKFKGMVQAALCYLVFYNNNMDIINNKEALFELYHPEISSSPDDANNNNKNNNKLSPYEAHAVAISEAALAYLDTNCRIADIDIDINNNNSNNRHHRRLELQKVMLIWSCNAFEGGLVYYYNNNHNNNNQSSIISRINHSCNPVAAMQMMTSTTRSPKAKAEKDHVATVTAVTAGSTTATSTIRQKKNSHCCCVIRAIAPIRADDEITISYLDGWWLYTDTATRQSILQQSKHFQCACERCLDEDIASYIPCPVCHPRQQQQQQQNNNNNLCLLSEDVQYDDDLTVHYVATPPPSSSTAAKESDNSKPTTVRCGNCHTQLSCTNNNSNSSSVYNYYTPALAKASQTICDKVRHFLRQQQQQASEDGTNHNNNDDDDDYIVIQQQQQLLELASSVLGARHWTTNLLLLHHLSSTLKNLNRRQLLHSIQQQQQAGPNNNNNNTAVDELEIAETVDSLQRLTRYWDGLGLALQVRGHALADVTVGVARLLVSLGDVKSQRYAAEWLAPLSTSTYLEHFASDGLRTVVTTLQTAWKQHLRNNDDDGDDTNEGKVANDDDDRKLPAKGDDHECTKQSKRAKLN